MSEGLGQYAGRVFGLRAQSAARPAPAVLPLPDAGTVTALLGVSGAGKTLALGALTRLHPGTRWVRPLPRARQGRPVHTLFDGQPPGTCMRVLAACGLADGRIWALASRQLSAGEQARLWLALALVDCPAGQLVVADEFDAHLDFDCACALAQNLCRLAQTCGLRVIVSTHRPELLPWLAPRRVLRLEGELHDQDPPAARDLADELTFMPGTLAHWPHFARWHYLGHGRPGPVAAVQLALLRGRPAGIAVFSFPHLLLSARRGALPDCCTSTEVLRHGARGLNARVRMLSRVVVDPRLRGCGVASRLLRHALPTLGVPWVECIAQMGEYTGFLARAGFVRAGQVRPPRAVQRLRAFAQAHGIGQGDLLGFQSRAALVARLPALAPLLDALVKSRIQSGHGSLRRGCGNANAALEGALGRLYAEPGYFLWHGGEHG